MAFDAFLEFKHGGKNVCEGETLDQQFSSKGAIQLISFNLQSKVDLSEDPVKPRRPDQKFFILKLKKDIDKASPDLFRAYCMHATNKAKSFDQAILTVRKAGGAKPLDYLVFDFRNVTLQTYKLENADKDSEPEEAIDLAFAALEIIYYPQLASGGGSAAPKRGAWHFGTHE